jgi:NAD(P)H-hydrate epimerase
MIAALIGQGLNSWDAARLGVHLHGMAGDRAAAALGPVSMIASDLIRYLPEVFK